MTENRGPELQAVCGTFVAMAFIATMLRVYVRLALVRAFGWDDAWMAAAMLTYIMFATTAIAGAHYGTGRRMADLSDEGIFQAMRYWWLCYISYCLTMVFAKISIGIFLLRVAVNRIHRWIIHIAIILAIVISTIFLFAVVFQCSPPSYFWDRSIEGGHCLKISVIVGLTYFYSTISAICDFTFGILPIFMVWNLNMTRSAKIMLVPILSMACVASTAILVRMAFIPDFKKDDFLFNTVDIAIWSDVEQGLAITAGSLATLRPLYRLISQRLGLSQSATNQLNSKQRTRDGYQSTSSHKPKRSGPFSLITLTRHDQGSINHSSDFDEESAIRNPNHTHLRDDLVEELAQERGFNSWQTQTGSDEDLKGVPTATVSRPTNVYFDRS